MPKRKRSKKNKTGFFGVIKTSSERYRTQIWIDGTMKNLGTYDTAKQAAKAYDTEAIKLKMSGMANASDDQKAKVVINHMSAEYIKAYSHHFVQQRNSQKRYAVTQSDLAIKNELLYYLSNHTHSRILDTSDVNFWRHKEEKTTKWISKHSRQNTNSNEPPLDDLLVIRACAAFQALTDCLRHWEGDKVLSENKLQVIFENFFLSRII